MSDTAPVAVTVVTIPLQSIPQTLSVSLNGTVYNLTVKWNWIMQAWVMDIADSGGNPLVGGIPLVPGADLLEQYEYLGIGGSMVVNNSFNPYTPPTFTNLGSQCNLLFVTPSP
jgi:hypothetical protein